MYWFRIWHIAFQDSVEMMKQWCQQCWAYKMLQTTSLLDLVDSNVTTLSKAAILQLQFHYKDVKAAAQQFFNKCVEKSGSKDCTIDQLLLIISTYEFWINCSQLQAKYLSRCLSWNHRMLSLKYGLGGHDLQFERSRFQQQNRHERFCQCCNLGYFEDLKHFILECPAFQEIWQLEFGCLFSVTVWLRFSIILTLGNYARS